jgi:hypothetical protein
MEGLIVISVSLTDQAVDDILQTAADAGTTYGIGYWGDIVRVNRVKAKRSPIVSMEVAERDVPRRQKVLTKVLLEHGITLAMTTGYNLKELDGPTADVIIQFAMFGELVYG